MAATFRQIAANRRNSLKSTGPKSDDGKRASRRNAVKHGLAGEGVVFPEAMQAAWAERREEWCSQFKPARGYDLWLVDRIAAESLRLEACEAHERRLVIDQAERAGHLWDEDRRAAVEVVAARLAAEPARVAAQLGGTAHGCDWLIDRWLGLIGRLAEHGDLDAEGRARALDLLGVAHELRADDDSGVLSASPEALLDLAEAQVVALRDRKGTILDALDDRERASAEAGLFDRPPKTLALARRYAASSLRRLAWYTSQLNALTVHPVSPPEPYRRPPIPTPPPATPPPPPASPAPSPTPPIAPVRPSFTPEEEARYRARLLASLARQAPALSADAPPLPPTPAPSPTPASRDAPPRSALLGPAPVGDRRKRRARRRRAKRRST